MIVYRCALAGAPAAVEVAALAWAALAAALAYDLLPADQPLFERLAALAPGPGQSRPDAAPSRGLR